MSNPASFMESGVNGAIDYRMGHDSSGPPNNWRRPEPPAGEDGSVPDLRNTVTGQFPNVAETGGGIDVSINNPIYPSTFDIPDSEMG